MFALSDELRQRLKQLSLLIVCGGTAVLPFTAPPASAIARAQLAPHESSISVPELLGRLQFPAILIQRDPFVADEASSSARPQISVASAGNADQIGIVLPPNAGAMGGTTDIAAGGAPVVRGIVLGHDPQALVDAGNGVKVYSVGDTIGNDRIKSIDAGGIVLASGLRLIIAHGSP